MKEPIITSLLDQDFYKFTMGQWVYHRYANRPVRYAFTNRTRSVRLAECLDEKELREQLDHVCGLRFTADELAYLQSIRVDGQNIFRNPEYIKFLRDLQLPPYRLWTEKGELKIEVSGFWEDAIYWEDFILAIVTQLYGDYACKDRIAAFHTGIDNLKAKIEILRKRPDIKFADFGLRRRFNRKWHAYVIVTVAEKLPKNFLGTCGVKLARDYGLQPIGTMAHELFMAMQGILAGMRDDLRRSHEKVIEEWWDEYGYSLSILLTDTLGTDFTFNIFTEEQARKWKGLRQDSGDPLAFAEKAIKFYKNHGIDPRSKLIVFSDGLDVETMVKIADALRDKIQFAFGWGTNLTNDVGIKPLSLVVKAVKACGEPLVKLSDNLAKAIGEPEAVERAKVLCGYVEGKHEECRY